MKEGSRRQRRHPPPRGLQGSTVQIMGVAIPHPPGPGREGCHKRRVFTFREVDMMSIMTPAGSKTSQPGTPRARVSASNATNHTAHLATNHTAQHAAGGKGWGSRWQGNFEQKGREALWKCAAGCRHILTPGRERPARWMGYWEKIRPGRERPPRPSRRNARMALRPSLAMRCRCLRINQSRTGYKARNEPRLRAVER